MERKPLLIGKQLDDTKNQKNNQADCPDNPERRKNPYPTPVNLAEELEDNEYNCKQATEANATRTCRRIIRHIRFVLFF